MATVPAAAITEGAVFAGRYHVVRCIARGGMGAIYEVVHLETQRRRALKVILPEVLQSADLKERFRQEARVAAQIESEFIVDVFDAGVDEATQMPFLVMELLKGEELGDRLKRVGRLPPDEVVAYLHQTALALDKTAAANIVHRDLKPENLFLTEREDGPPRIKVLDFGVAKVIADGNTQSQATRAVGTPLYMAPEQFSAGSRVSPLTDIYALGQIAYTLLTGRAYFADDAEQADNIFVFVGAIQQGITEPASARAARMGVALPPAFDAWFARITSKDPKARFPRAVVAIAELAQALGVQAPSSGAARGSSPALPAPGPVGAPVYSPSASGPVPAAAFNASGSGPVGAPVYNPSGSGPVPAAAFNPSGSGPVPVGGAAGTGTVVATMVSPGAPGVPGQVPFAAHSTGPQAFAPHASGPQPSGVPAATMAMPPPSIPVHAAPAPPRSGSPVPLIIGAVGLVALGAAVAIFVLLNRAPAEVPAPAGATAAPALTAPATATQSTTAEPAPSASATAEPSPSTSASTSTGKPAAAAPRTAAPRGTAPSKDIFSRD